MFCHDDDDDDDKQQPILLETAGLLLNDQDSIMKICELVRGFPQLVIIRRGINFVTIRHINHVRQKITIQQNQSHHKNMTFL